MTSNVGKSTPVTKSVLLAALVMLPVTASAQESCAEYPELSSCVTTAVGVCDAQAAADYVIHQGDNNWLVRPAEEDSLYPGQCSYENGLDPINPRTITTKDDTNNLQCALDFAAAGRGSVDMSATIQLERARYCVRDTLVGLDFSGTISGAGKNRTVIDFDNPALMDAQGQLTGEGGFQFYQDVEKSVIGQDGEAIALFDRVENQGDAPTTTTARRYYKSNVGGIVFANNRYNARKLLVKNLHLNVAKGTRSYTETIHGYGNTVARPGSIGSIFTDATELGGRTFSLGGRSNEVLQNCAARAESTSNYNGPEAYEADTGVDLTTLDPELCIVPINDMADVESPKNPRNCSAASSCTPYAFDLDNLPSLDTRFVGIKATAYGNTNNGIYYLNADRNESVDILVSGETPLPSITQPVHLNLVLKDSILRGLSSPFVGSIFDFGGTPVVDGSIVIKDNYMGVLDADQTYGCGRLWERISLSGTRFIFQDNRVFGCQGTIVRHGGVQLFDGRGVDGGDLASGSSALPFPEVSTMTLQRNVYKQGPVVPGYEDVVTSFFLALDFLNSEAVESESGVPVSTLKVHMLDNVIRTANYAGEDIDPYIMIPVSLIGLNDTRIRDNRIRGRSAAAIAIGQPLGFGPYDRNGRIIDNDLSGFKVVACDTSPNLSACSGSTAEEEDAATKKIWLGPLSSETTVVSPNPGSASVGDLGTNNTVIP